MWPSSFRLGSRRSQHNTASGSSPASFQGGKILTEFFYNSGWSDFHLGPIHSGLLAHRGREVLVKLAERGVAIPPGNRLERAVTLTERTNDDFSLLNNGTAEFRDRAKEAFRTLWECFVITWTVVERRPGPEALPTGLLRYLLEGGDLPGGEKNPKPRNTQFELLVGASLVLGGAAVSVAEPDFRILYHGEVIGIAVKRLSSIKPTKLYDELRDAARQLRKAELRGFVAVNLDRWISELTTDADVAELGASFNKQLREAHRQIGNIAEREALLGVLIYAHYSDWVFHEGIPSFDWREPHQIIGFTDSQIDMERAREFFEPLRARLENSLTEIAALVTA